MNIPTPQLPDVIRALEHYAAYMRATNRDERPFRELAEQLKRKRAGKRKPAAALSKIVVRVRTQRR